MEAARRLHHGTDAELPLHPLPPFLAHLPAQGWIVDQIEETLKEQTDGARRLRILKVETTEHGELKAKFAFLINKSEFDEFKDAAEKLAQEHQVAGVRLELTGPWPAYNFLTGLQDLQD